MHYNVNEFLIKSELAAKPISQTNKSVTEYISYLPKHIDVLDYGCGKLRYSIPLANHVNRVIAIDSCEQIKLLKESQYYNIRNLRVMCIDNQEWSNHRFDVVFCTNVLSAIPFESYRMDLLEKARSVLSTDGYLFITVQYRNSYFSQYQYREDTIPFRDGWLIKNKSTNICSFYAMLNPEYISALCYRAGFKNMKVKRKDGSCFIEARL